MTEEITFTSRVKKREGAEASAIRVALDTVDEETGEVTFTESYVFRRPSDSRMLMLMATFRKGSAVQNMAGELLDTFSAMLSDEDFASLRERLDGEDDKRVELEDLVDLFGILMERWSDGFPTQPSSGSSTPRPRTGGRSTGRSPGKGSTRSTSTSPAS